MKLLRPTNVTPEDYIAFLISHRMAKLGNTPDGIFNELDNDRSGAIDEQELVRGIKETLDIMLSDQTIIEAFIQLSGEDRVISRNDFLNRVNMANYIKYSTHDRYVVSKAQFLNVLVLGFNYVQRRDAARLNQRYRNMTKDLDKNVLKNALLEIDPDLSDFRLEEYLGQIYETSREEDVPLEISHLIRTILRNGIGTIGTSVYAVPELNQDLQDREYNYALEVAGSKFKVVLQKQDKPQMPEILNTEEDEEEVRTIYRVIKKKKKSKRRH